MTVDFDSSLALILELKQSKSFILALYWLVASPTTAEALMCGSHLMQVLDCHSLN